MSGAPIDAACDADKGGASELATATTAHTRTAVWREVVLALGVLALATASSWLCVRAFGWSPAERNDYVTLNKLPQGLRKRLLVELIVAAGLPLLFGLPLYAARGARAVPLLTAAAERLAPFTLAFSLPMLLNAQLWSGRPISFLVLLLAVVLGVERLVARALRREVPARQSADDWLARLIPLALVVCAAAAYAAYTSHFSILRHQRLASAGFDLGIFDNLMQNALEGRPFHSSIAVPKGSYLSNHAEFGMFLFVPVYALWPRAETLLVIQSVFMGFAAVPLYAFAATQVPRMAAATLALAYLLFAPLHGPNFFDFHWMPVSIPFFFWLFYALATRQAALVALLAIIICSLREDAPFGLIATGLFLIATGVWPKAGAWLTVVPAAWFVVVKFVIMPLAGPWWFSEIYRELFAPGEKGYGSVVRTILVNPNYFLKTLLTEGKLAYTLHMLAPLAFLPLRHPALALLALPGFVVTLMTTGYAPTLSISFQYTTHWIPFLFAAAAIALGLIRSRRGIAAGRGALVALCVGVLCHSYVYGAILQRETFVGGFSRVSFTMTAEERKRYRDLKTIVAKVPARASIATTEREVPHISNRPTAYSLKITAGNAEYLLLHRHQFDSGARRKVEEALVAQPYDLVATEGDYLLFQRGKSSIEGERALRGLSLSVPLRAGKP